MNLRFVKLNHHYHMISTDFLGNGLMRTLTFEGVLPSAYTRANSLIANSCLT